MREVFVDRLRHCFTYLSRGDTRLVSMKAEKNSKNVFNTLLPAISLGLMIVMDNATYHSRTKDKAPTSSFKKPDVVDWP